MYYEMLVTLPQVLAQSSLRARELLASKKGPNYTNPAGATMETCGRVGVLLNDSTKPGPLPEIVLTAS